MALFNKFMTRRSRLEPDRELRDIVDNLNSILNTRKGYGSILKDLGIRDLNEFCSRQHIAEAIMEEVRRNIATYEPRVQLTSIVQVEDENPLHLSFRIECTLRESSQALHMVFDSLINSVQLDEK
jgi:type VI secretion system protein